MTKRAGSGDAMAMEPAKLLLVDDDEVRLLVTGAALRQRGFEVTEVSSGQAALDALSRSLPDAVVLDALMPEPDGFATCRRLRERSGCGSIPVLMLTGLDDDESIQRAYDAGATDFFVKSEQWNLLAGRLRHLLRASRMRIELEQSKAKLARAQDIACMGSFEWKRGHSSPTLSDEARRVLRFSPRAPLGLRKLIRLLPREERDRLLGLLRDVVRSGSVLSVNVMVPARNNDGERVLRVDAEPEFNELGQLVGYTGILQDISERHQAQRSITRLRNYDTLTGLPNRHQMTKRVETALACAEPLGHQVALLLAGLDRFKIINDTLGHAAGDELLKEVARRFKTCVRHTDKYPEQPQEAAGSRSHRALESVARLGGDEFVVLLPEVIDERDAERVAARILELMHEPIMVAGQECFVTASVGIAVSPRDGESWADLHHKAELAMHAAKTAGRNILSVYSPALAGKTRDELELESALHKAIERNELVLHYQPKVDVRRPPRMVGAEALMRWSRAGRLLAPAEFIPQAEDTGLIVPMSAWAIREAARQARQWRDQFGFADSIAVNVPARLFERSDVVEYVNAAVSEFGLPHSAIEIEITETGLMGSQPGQKEGVIPALHRLNENGVSISIDDFGTGYSMLAYLATLPVSELKIDRSFVRDLGLTQPSNAIVTAIIALARSLGLRVVAEGVENLRQMEVLRGLGCSVMQGFLFSRPQPAEQIEPWLRQTVMPRDAAWARVADDDDRRATPSPAKKEGGSWRAVRAD